MRRDTTACLSALVHTPCTQTHVKPCSHTYADCFFITTIFSPTFAPSVASYQITVWVSAPVPKMQICCMFTTEKGIYMYNMQLFTLRQCIVSISASIKSSQTLTADTSAIEMPHFFSPSILIHMQTCWLFIHTNSECTEYSVSICCKFNGENAFYS